MPYLNGFQYNKWLNSSIWLIIGTLTGTTIPGQSEPESNSNQGVLHILQSFRTGEVEGVLLLCRDAVSIFYSPLTGQRFSRKKNKIPTKQKSIALKAIHSKHWPRNLGKIQTPTTESNDINQWNEYLAIKFSI